MTIEEFEAWCSLCGRSIFTLRSVFIGIFATIAMDVLSVTALKLGFIAFLPPLLTGRWLAYVARGQFLHRDIAQIAPIHHELAIAVPANYAIGVTLALGYLFASSFLGIPARNPIAALGFALGTNLLPWLLMFLAMGYGWFGASENRRLLYEKRERRAQRAGPALSRPWQRLGAAALVRIQQSKVVVA